MEKQMDKAGYVAGFVECMMLGDYGSAAGYVTEARTDRQLVDALLKTTDSLEKWLAHINKNGGPLHSTLCAFSAILYNFYTDLGGEK